MNKELDTTLIRENKRRILNKQQKHDSDKDLSLAFNKKIELNNNLKQLIECKKDFNAKLFYEMLMKKFKNKLLYELKSSQLQYISILIPDIITSATFQVISSPAFLITLYLYWKHCPELPTEYLIKFLGTNIGLLVLQNILVKINNHAIKKIKHDHLKKLKTLKKNYFPFLISYILNLTAIYYLDNVSEILILNNYLYHKKLFIETYKEKNQWYMTILYYYIFS